MPGPAKRKAAKGKPNGSIAAGFALQLLKSPKKIRAPVLEDEIVFSDEENPRKRKAAQAFGRPSTDRAESQTWLDCHVTLRELCVNKKKVQDVQKWIQSAFDRVAEHTLLILSGSAGTGKTATVRALAEELDFDILEWQNPMSHSVDYDRDADGLAQKFEQFLTVSDKYSALDFGQEIKDMADVTRRKIVLVEDIPNTFSANSSQARIAFQTSLKRYLISARNRFPLILIITETEPRGEDNDFRRSDAMSIRTLLTKDILAASNCTHITFNDVAPTFIAKALNGLIDALPSTQAVNISPAVIDEIARNANGDIRSAINSLDFISHKFTTHRKFPRKKRKRGEVLSLTDEERKILNIVTNRESALGYFHAIGKVVYNKRVPGSITTGLPPHLLHHARDRLENEAALLLDETSTDASTFIAGVHQNFIDSVSDVEDSWAIMDAISRSDAASYGFHYSYTGAHAAIAISTIKAVQHFLPREIVRNHASKIYYPNATKMMKRRREILDAVDEYGSLDRRTAIEQVIPFDDLIHRARNPNIPSKLAKIARLKQPAIAISEDIEDLVEEVPARTIKLEIPIEVDDEIEEV